MKPGEQKGQAAIELMAAAPLVALFLIIIAQVASIFSMAVRDVAEADAKAQRATLAWDIENSARGFRRPCLEEMGIQSVAHGGSPLPVGAGGWRRDIAVPQEVHIVDEPVCVR